MLIDTDSPLRRIPLAPGVVRSQRMFLDGMRYSIEIAEIAFHRLKKTLMEASGDEGDSRAEFPSALLDAWAVVDSAYRLLGLMRKMRGIERTPEATLIRRGLEPVKDLRNCIQHLNKEILKHVDVGQPVWGSLSWVFSPQLSFDKYYKLVMIPGSIGEGQKLTLTGDNREVRVPGMANQPVVRPDGRTMTLASDMPIDLIELTAYGRTLSLSETYDWIERFTRGLEERLRKPPWDKAPRGHADLVVRYEVL